jgi:hypothetical protein
MNPFLGLLAFCAGLALLALIVSRITGARAYFLENWEFLPGETVVWRDDHTDVMEVPRVGGATFMRPIRMRRWSVVQTDRRVILANRSFTGKRMVMYVLWFGASPDPNSRKLGGGLLTRGYIAMAVAPGVWEADRDYVAYRPVRAEASSLNVLEIRVYTAEATAVRGG